jgi:hypothetical protein
MQKKQFISPPPHYVKRTQMEISKVKEFMVKIKDAKGDSGKLDSVIKEIEAEIKKLEDTKIPVRMGGPFEGPHVHY